MADSADSSLRAGEAAELHGDFGAAVAAYAHVIDAGDSALAGEARFRLGRVAWRQGRYDDALNEYAVAAKIAGEQSLTNLRARVENGIGAVHYARGAYTQARASYGIALELAADDTRLLGKVLLNLGVIFNIEGNLAAALDSYQRSRDAFALAGDDGGLALVLHNLGMVYADREMWVEARESFVACLELSERLGDRQMVANVLLNQSEIDRAEGRLDVAIAHCERATIIYAELGDEPGRGDALRARASALRLAGRVADAESSASEAQLIAARLQLPLLAAEADRERALIRIASADVTGAVALLESALAGFIRLGARREVSEVQHDLAAARGATRAP